MGESTAATVLVNGGGCVATTGMWRLPVLSLYGLEKTAPGIQMRACMSAGTEFRIGELITARGFKSVSEFARWLKKSHINMSQPHINNVRNNSEKTRNIGLQSLSQIAWGLQVPVWALFADAPPYEVQPFALNGNHHPADKLHVNGTATFPTPSGDTASNHIVKIPSPRLRIRTYVKRRGTNIGQLWTDRLRMPGQQELLSLGYFYTVASNDAPNVGLQRLEDIADMLQVPVWALFADAPAYDGVSLETLEEEDAQALQLPLLIGA
jgi:hypothetical protein